MTNIDFKKIVQVAVDEVVGELKQEIDNEKIDETVRAIDAVNMITEVVQNTLKDIGADPEQLGEEGIKKIAKESAKAAILESVKTLK